MSQHLGNTLKTRDNEIQLEYLFMLDFLHLKAPDQLGTSQNKTKCRKSFFCLGYEQGKKTTMATYIDETGECADVIDELIPSQSFERWAKYSLTITEIEMQKWRKDHK